jgi:ribosomal protein S18 acetylase RimI-like enzyme
VVSEAFSQHWGYVTEPFEDWWPSFAGRSDFDEGLVLIAEEAGGEVVGALTGQKGDGYGWVRDLGVVGRVRGRGIGAALLEHSFALFAARGYPKVILNVDAHNETGATRLYERVGMRQMRQFDCYEKELG